MSAYRGDGRWDLEKLDKLGYKTGSILRVKMLNFLTYDEAEVFPGPRLNVLLGPNGTGKSTVTHAICLACGGNGSTVGRSPELNQFVKHGKEGKESFCEVDILRPGEVATIRRVINSENKGSKWFLNKQKATENQIKGIMNELNIDVNNLCSFMAQDKVGKFTQFTAKEVLEKTLQSIVLAGENKTLYTEQVELANIEITKRDKERVVDAKRKDRMRMSMSLEQMQVEVDRMKNREEAKRSVKLYETKLTVLEAREGNRLKEEKQAAVDEAQRALVDAEKTIEPLEIKHRELIKQQSKRDKDAEKAASAFQEAEKELRILKETIEELDIAAADAKSELEMLDVRRKQDEAKHEQAQREAEKTRQSLEKALEAIPALEERQKETSANLQQLSGQEGGLADAIRDIHEQMSQKTDEMTQATREISELRDFKQVFRNRLQQGNFRDAVGTMDWIEKNKEQLMATGRLKQEVYGPVAMHIKVTDPACAAMLEKAVPLGKLFAVIVQNDEDERFLRLELQKAGLKPNFYTMKNLSTPPPPLSQDFLEQFRDIGMQGYLLEQVECPRAVHAFLEIFCSLNTVFWTRQTQQHAQITEQHEMRLGAGNDKMGNFKLYVQRGNEIEEHVVSKSRYARGNVSINTNAVRPGRILGAGGEEISEKKAELEQRIARAKQQRDELDRAATQRKGEMDNLMRQITELKHVRMQLQRSIMAPKDLERKLISDQKKVEDIAKRLQGDIAKEREQKRKAYAKAIENFLTAMEGLVKSGRDILGLDVQKNVTALARRELKRDISIASAALDDARSSLAQLKKDLAIAKKEREEAQVKFATAEKKLEEMQSEMGIEGFKAFYLQVKRECPEDDAEAIINKIYALRAQIESAVDNPQILERYEEMKVKIAELDEELQALSKDYENVENSLQGRLEEWINKVENLARKLNNNFAEYMDKLRYRGEVVLKRQGSIADYEMQMRVGFRVDSSIDDLSGNRHSGGERAVSTIMYLMALQDLISAPFRVVDEINQGMDEANERNVFDRIVTECCGDVSKPQYFLVSPKLLQGLRAMEHNDVTVLMVFNGPGITKKWTISDVLRELKKEKGLSIGDDDDGTSEEEASPDSQAGKRKAPLLGSASSATASASASAKGPATKARRIQADDCDD